ncbi:MAG: RnfABCDGE type electron transport complex subunit B [Bacteroidales bacterium]
MSLGILSTVVMLTVLGIILALILYAVAQKFKVVEDPKIDEVEAALPGANCGGCGYAGCRAFAVATVSASDLSTLFCPVGGNDCMSNVAQILGQTVEAKEPQVAVVRCNGRPEYRPQVSNYEGAKSCAIEASMHAGSTGCWHGCLGKGDCAVSCKFDALYIDEQTKLPVVNEDKCTACGACVKACPKFIIELRKKGPKGRRIFVSGINKEKGGVARKSCTAACIACTKCEKACAFEAITITKNLAYIDSQKCKLCRKCASECPTNAIWEVNFPPKKEAPTVKEGAAQA